MNSHWVPVKHDTAYCDATPGVTLSVTLTGDRGRGRELTRALPVPHWAPAHTAAWWLVTTQSESPTHSGPCHKEGRGASAVIPFVAILTPLTQFWSLEMNVAVNCVKESLLFARVVCSQPSASGRSASPRPLQPGFWEPETGRKLWKPPEPAGAWPGWDRVSGDSRGLHVREAEPGAGATPTLPVTVCHNTINEERLTWALSQLSTLVS